MSDSTDEVSPDGTASAEPGARDSAAILGRAVVRYGGTRLWTTPRRLPGETVAVLDKGVEVVILERSLGDQMERVQARDGLEGWVRMERLLANSDSSGSAGMSSGVPSTAGDVTEREYPALTVVAGILRIVGWIYGGLSTIVAIRILDSDYDYNLELALGVLMVGWLIGIVLIAIAEVIRLIKDIERNTRIAALKISGERDQTQQPQIKSD